MSVQKLAIRYEIGIKRHCRVATRDNTIWEMVKPQKSIRGATFSRLTGPGPVFLRRIVSLSVPLHAIHNSTVVVIVIYEF